MADAPQTPPPPLPGRGQMNAFPDPRVAQRAAAPPRCSTRGYMPTPHSGRWQLARLSAPTEMPVPLELGRCNAAKVSG